MCKNLKIKFIITIIAIMFLSLVIPSITNKSLAVGRNGTSVSGVYSNDSYGEFTWNNITKGQKVYISGSFFSENLFTFCIQHGKDLNFKVSPREYNASGNIFIDGSTSKILNGLAYILNQDNSGFDRTIPNGGSGNWNGYQNDPVQLALWAYLTKYSKDINTALRKNEEIGEYANDKFYFPSQTKETTIKTNKNTNKKYLDGGENIVDYHIGGDRDYGYNGYEIFANAEKAKNGTDTNIYTANVYILVHRATWFDNGDKKWHSEYQRTMLVEESDTVEPVPLEIEITKELSSGTSNENFEFTVQFTQNGSTASVTENIKQNDKKTFKYDTTDTTNDITVDIIETSNDSNYDASDKITVRYKYSKQNKRWEPKNDPTTAELNTIKKFIRKHSTESNYDRYDKYDNRLRRKGKIYYLTFVNPYNPTVKLRFDKVDSSNNKAIEGAKIKIECNSNIKKFKYWIFSKVVDRKR